MGKLEDPVSYVALVGVIFETASNVILAAL
jgi:hypothetical protein